MNILIGITGSISAYKMLDLLRKFIKSGHNVKVILTENAKHFIPLLPLRTFITEVFCDQFDTEIKQPVHIMLAKWADVMLISPATLNTIGKMANGLSDNLLLDTFFAFTGRTLVAPAMNDKMYENEILNSNIEKLKKMNIIFIPPASGFLASYHKGKGKLEDIDVIFTETINARYYSNDLKDKKVLIIAGGTQEEIDPVRVISNRSEGRMGKELALAFYRNGAEVKMVSSVDMNLPNVIEMIPAKSVNDFFQIVKKNLKWCDIYVSAAALSDFVPIIGSKKKIKKEVFDGNIKLKKAIDILEYVQKAKKKGQIIVGFAAETELDLNAIKVKFSKKPVDVLVVNQISEKYGFGDRSVFGHIFYRNKVISMDDIPKEKTAGLILKAVKEII